MLERVELETVTVPLSLEMPPPWPNEALLERVELETVRVPPPLLEMPPPPPLAELPERVELVTVRMPVLKMPPPLPVLALLPERVELETARVPALIKAPPLPVTCAPETVTPEIKRFPPEAMLKMLKLRLTLPLLPLIVREEAPRPLMVTLPAVPPPVIAVVVSMMFGNAEVKVMVPEAKEKLMVSLPGVVLAMIIASLKEVKLSVESTVSAVVVTAIPKEYAPISEVVRLMPR